MKVFLTWQAVSHNSQVEMLQRKTEELHTTTMAGNHANKTAKDIVVSWSLAILENVLEVTVISIL